MSVSRLNPQHNRNEHPATYESDEFFSDEKLVALAKSGDRKVFDELRRRHATTIFRVVFRITRHREDAEDAVQEAFLSAYMHLRAFDGRAQFSTWLTRIATNAALMKLRKNRRSHEIRLDNATQVPDDRLVHELRDFSPSPEEICQRGEQETALRDAVAKLPLKLRRAVELYQLQECSMDETAKVLGISVAAAKGRLFHARTALRRNRDLSLKHRGIGRKSTREMERNRRWVKLSFSRLSTAAS